MYRSDYETQATIGRHRQALMREVERERLLANTHRIRLYGWRSPRGWGIFASLRRVLAGTGRWLISVGTKLEARYADGAVGSHFRILSGSES